MNQLTVYISVPFRAKTTNLSSATIRNCFVPSNSTLKTPRAAMRTCNQQAIAIVIIIIIIIITKFV